MRRRFHGFHRVGHGHREAAARHHRQVRQVVAHECASFGREAELRREALERRELVRGALDHVRDRKLRGPALDRRRLASGKDRGGHARRLQHLHAVAVEDVERLERFALRTDVERAIGEHAVDVEDREANRASALGDPH